MGKKALVVIDMQNDFVLPTGSLSVRNAEKIIPIINTIRNKFQTVMFTQDWHPKDHVSFFTNHPGHKAFDVVQAGQVQQMLFAPHAVQNTPGAEIHHEIVVRNGDLNVRKGTRSDIDSFSCFFDVIKTNHTNADEQLKAAGVDTIYVLGVATDFCVKFSVLDALSIGYKVFVIEDGIYGVDDAASRSAIDEMKSKGAVFIKSSKV